MVDPENTGSVQMLLRFYLHLLVHFYKEKASSDLLQTGSFLVPQVRQLGRNKRAVGSRKLGGCTSTIRHKWSSVIDVISTLTHIHSDSTHMRIHTCTHALTRARARVHSDTCTSTQMRHRNAHIQISVLSIPTQNTQSVMLHICCVFSFRRNWTLTRMEEFPSMTY